jgi:class 3 adenylate cyclase
MSHAGLFDRRAADRSASSRDLSTITTSRRLSATLAADVAGYSRLMGANEERTHERLKAHRRQLVDRKIKEDHGRIVKTTGDGMLVEFPSGVDAVRYDGRLPILDSVMRQHQAVRPNPTFPAVKLGEPPLL